ncbi:Phosphoglycerol transferase MdoB [Parelusimicrobium proximum]|uniref:LTA synthase family protein n=1 Tax=Parelusimicrobium proximum TaxID=3228953 RepID=UPI003D185D91
MKSWKMPAWAKYYLIFLAVSFVIFFLFRLAFLYVFRAALTEDVVQHLGRAFFIGAEFDGRLAGCIGLPFLIFGFIQSFFKSVKVWIQKIFAAFYSLVFTVLVLGYFADFGQYAYIAVRLNASIFKYFENIWISMEMGWQTYPVIRGTLALIVVLYLGYKLMSVVVRKISADTNKGGWKAKAGYGFGLLLLTAYLVYGQVGWYPLRWSNAYFTTNSFVSNFTLNPILNTYDTYKFSKMESFDVEKVKEYYPLISDYLGVDNPDAEKLNFERHVSANPRAKAKGYNVVIIIMESFAWNKSSFSNTQIDATPFAKELARSSILFNQFYTPTSATARAVFATMSSIPDISSFKTSSRNPFIVNQQMIINEAEGYEKMYFIGGSASWGNIRGIIKNNVDGLRLYEEDNMKGNGERDVWGMSDLQLVRNANEILGAETKPFFAVIQTAGYHRPYTIPEDNAGFVKETVDEELLKSLSFVSLDEYNSLRFSDHVLKEFFDMAKKEDYYDNTIFVIYGDHGLGAPQAENMPRGYQVYNLINWHVPLIIHAPRALKPDVIHRTASQVDVMPTIAGLLGIEYKTSAIGRDLFDSKYFNKQGALVYGWSEAPPTISFVSGEYIYYDKAGKVGLYKFAEKDYNNNLKDADNLRFNKMKDTAHGLYETSRYLLYNNPKTK